MKTLALILAAVLASSSAHAGIAEERPGLVGLPPVEFDDLPRVPVEIARPKDQAAMHAHCDPMVPALKSQFVLGCGCGRRYQDGVCRVVIASDQDIARTSTSFEIVYRHEIGHCNGWPASHPGMR
jgi:hypothetical protein